MKQQKVLLILLGFLFVAALLGTIYVMVLQEEGAVVEISRDGELLYTLPLEEDTSLTVTDEAGNYNVVLVEDGKVSVTHASCPDGICMAHAPTDSTADPIVCLPNRLVVEVVHPDGEGDGLDGVT